MQPVTILITGRTGKIILFTIIQFLCCLYEESFVFLSCRQAERCPLIFLSNAGSNSTDAFNRQYVYYGKAQNDDREVYITTDHPFVYLYQVDDVWYLTDGLQKNAIIYAKVRQDAGVAEKLGRNIWLVNTSAEWKKVAVDVKCDRK